MDSRGRVTPVGPSCPPPPPVLATGPEKPSQHGQLQAAWPSDPQLVTGLRPKVTGEKRAGTSESGTAKVPAGKPSAGALPARQDFREVSTQRSWEEAEVPAKS